MKSVRIAGGLGFYGDSWRPIKASIERGNVQYVASDHLAELTLAILQKDRQRDPNLGYTRDFAPMLLDLLPLAIPLGVKFIFFFQAEDGIRDLTVTGVQTCALPI